MEQVRMKNEYIQYLRVCLLHNVGVLPAPFSTQPPETTLVPLAELLANLTADKYPSIPRTGEYLIFLRIDLLSKKNVWFYIFL
jgi:hypothetical protein